MSFEIFTGTVSHASERVTVRAGRRATSSKVTTTFRLDNTPVSMEGPAEVADGDIVTAVGTVNGSQMQAFILRNDSTGAVYNEVTPSQIAFVALGVLVSVILIPILVGLAFLPFMLWYAYKLFRIKKAQAKLRAASPSTPSMSAS
ncbi:MAG: hypothetical protein AB8B62_01270 [Roseobacter sp.]